MLVRAIAWWNRKVIFLLRVYHLCKWDMENLTKPLSDHAHFWTRHIIHKQRIAHARMKSSQFMMMLLIPVRLLFKDKRLYFRKRSIMAKAWKKFKPVLWWKRASNTAKMILQISALLSKKIRKLVNKLKNTPILRKSLWESSNGKT